jgi:hypothetical protein
MTDGDQRRGTLLARLLAGAWRPDIPPISLSRKELDLILPLVVKSGAAALAWRRIRGTALATTVAGRKLHEARIVMAVEATIRESLIERLLSMESLSGADPILFKGWANARLYPEPGLRPYGDFDLFVLPERCETVASACMAIPSTDPLSGVPVDVHPTWVDLPDRTWDDIHAHSRVVPVGSSRVRILGSEDSVRLSCLHLLRHAVEMPPRGNPLWLCDVGVMLENVPPDFDWDYCLAGQQPHTQWMVAVIRLANQVLGASVDRCPIGTLPASVPSWMQNTFLRVWGKEERYGHPPSLPRPLGWARRDLRELPRALADRWPSPLQSVYRLSWPINSVPGRLAQIVDYSARALTWGPRQVSNHRGRATVG